MRTINEIIGNMLLGYKRIRICKSSRFNVVYIKRESKYCRLMFHYHFYVRTNEVHTSMCKIHNGVVSLSKGKIITFLS